MEDNSELHPESLRIQCNKAIEVIDKENEAYEELISKLRTNIVENDTMSGEAADSIKAYASDLIFVVEYAIEANELDKVDHQALLDEIDSVLADRVDVNEVLRGYEIHTNIINIENRIDEYDRLVELYNPAGEGLIMSLFYDNKQEEYKDQIKDLERELEDWKYKEERYDVISSNTEGLFCSSTSIRNDAKKTVSGMLDLIKCNTEGYIDYYKNNEDPVIVDLYKKRYIKRKYPDLYTYLAGLKDENGEILYDSMTIISFIIKLESKDSYLLKNLNVLKENLPSEYTLRLNDIVTEINNYSTYNFQDYINDELYISNGIYKITADYIYNINAITESELLQKIYSVYENNKDVYETISNQTNMPPELIAAIHYRESDVDYFSGEFNVYIQNGQVLGEETTLAPQNIYYEDFISSAVDWFTGKAGIDYFSGLISDLKLSSDSKDLIAMAAFSNLYNGMNSNIISNYVYSGTNIYIKGMFVEDGKYDPNVVDKRPGTVAIIKYILENEE